MLEKKTNEIRRTYFITNPKNGMKFFKMYTPSEAQKAFKKNGWKGKIVGKLEASVEKKKEKPRDVPRKTDSIRMSDFARV